MLDISAQADLIWTITALATLGVIVRPSGWPEAIWATAGAVALVACRLLPPAEAWRGVVRGTDVYLFLTGMMLLAELARDEGLFDWLAAHAARGARGSPGRLFTLTYIVGVVVTVFLSNDATAVVLTPAVAAAARAAAAETALPYLLICAMVANAGSFVLPISNPANLVIYGAHMPPLGAWLWRFGVPSLAAILATYGALRVTQRRALRGALATDIAAPTLPPGGWCAALGLGATALLLMLASARGWPLGLPTCLAGLVTSVAVLAVSRRNPLGLVRGVSWGVLPLVAGLFVLVQGLDHTGLLTRLGEMLRAGTRGSAVGTAWGAGVALAALCNVVNNLPAGLISGVAVQSAHAPDRVTGAVLIGIDLGPNLSVTGSLATILWLAALKREGLSVSAWSFLRVGALVMPPALLLALAALQVAS